MGKSLFYFILLISAITSSQINAQEKISFISAGAEWKYLDNGADLGTAWKESDFDDSSWKIGKAAIGFGNVNIVTAAERGDVGSRNITYYFRKEFTSKVADSLERIGKELKLDILRDDGVVIYLNGKEILRDNMPDGEITWGTLALSSVLGNDESTYYERIIDSNTQIESGRNVIAVEVHQFSIGSNDLSFDLKLEGIIEENPTKVTVESLVSRHKGSAVDLTEKFLIIGAPHSPMNDFTVSFTDGSSANTWELGTGEVQIYKKLNSVWIKHSTLTASNGERNDLFGHSVAISSDTIVVGAPYEDGDSFTDSGSGSGAVYVFKLIDDKWMQTAYLKAEFPGTGDRFGFSVGISGERIIVGAPDEDSATNDPLDNNAYDSGAAYIFTLENNNWLQESFLKAFNSDSNDQFGYSVSIWDEKAIVGAPREDGDGKISSNNSNYDSGAVYIFERNATDNGGAEEKVTEVLVAEDQVKKALVPTEDIGYDWVQLNYDDSTWTDVEKTDEDGTVVRGGVGFARSGTRVDQFDPFIALDLEEQMYRTSATVFLRIPFIVEDKSQFHSLVLGVRTDDGFVAWLNGEKVRVFKGPEEPQWDSEATASNSDSIAQTIKDYSLNEYMDKLVIGQNILAIQALNKGKSGSDFLFSCELKSKLKPSTNQKWSNKAYLKASNSDPHDMFGNFVTMDNESLIVGAPLEDSNGTSENNNSKADSGAVYVYSFSGFQWQQTHYIKSENIQESAQFGHHADLDESLMIISAPNHLSEGSNILFGTNHPKKVLLPTQDIGLEWIDDKNYDDSNWTTTTGGIGFEKEPNRLSKRSYLGLYDLDLSREMFDNATPQTTLYVRIPFKIKDKDKINSLKIFMQCDDGFILYLNSSEIYRFNSPPNPDWRSASSSYYWDEGVIEGDVISLDEHVNKLLEGNNLLAIHAMNSDGVAALRDISTDFLMNCSLSATLQPQDRGRAFIYSKQDNKWQLKKTINESSGKGILFGEGIAVAGNTFVASTPREPGVESIADNVAAITYEKQNDSWNKTDVLGDKEKKSTFTFRSFNGINYSVQVSNNLKEWITIESNISGTGSEITKEYILPGNSQFFRRVEETEPIIGE